MEELKNMITNDCVRTCKFIQYDNGGLAIKLEGYPISYIKIIRNTKSGKYNLLFRDVDGWVYRFEKDVNGELLTATINNTLREIKCT